MIVYPPRQLGGKAETGRLCVRIEIGVGRVFGRCLTQPPISNVSVPGTCNFDHYPRGSLRARAIEAREVLLAEGMAVAGAVEPAEVSPETVARETVDVLEAGLGLTPEHNRAVQDAPNRPGYDAGPEDGLRPEPRRPSCRQETPSVCALLPNLRPPASQTKTAARNRPRCAFGSRPARYPHRPRPHKHATLARQTLAV